MITLIEDGATTWSAKTDDLIRELLALGFEPRWVDTATQLVVQPDDGPAYDALCARVPTADDVDSDAEPETMRWNDVESAWIVSSGLYTALADAMDRQ